MFKIRVGVILCIEEKKIYFLGYGEHVGNEIPITATNYLGKYCQENGLPNPKLVLDDNGEVIWGCECFWSSEEETRKQIDELIANGYEVVMADIKSIRK